MKTSSLRRLLIKENILTYGDFTLRSGAKSSYYCDVKSALGNPDILNDIVRHMLSLIPPTTTCIACSGYGGITLGSIIAYKKKIPVTLVRDTVKDHGTRKIIDGYIPTKNDRVCIVDDVFTTGSSIADTKQKLAVLRCRFVMPVVVINRSRKNTVMSVLTDGDLVGINN